MLANHAHSLSSLPARVLLHSASCNYGDVATALVCDLCKAVAVDTPMCTPGSCMVGNTCSLAAAHRPETVFAVPQPAKHRHAQLESSLHMQARLRRCGVPASGRNTQRWRRDLAVCGARLGLCIFVYPTMHVSSTYCATLIAALCQPQARVPATSAHAHAGEGGKRLCQVASIGRHTRRGYHRRLARRQVHSAV